MNGNSWIRFGMCSSSIVSRDTGKMDGWMKSFTTFYTTNPQFGRKMRVGPPSLAHFILDFMGRNS